MGTTISGTSTSQATPTAEEQAMEKIQLGQYQQFAPSQTQMFQNAFGLGNQLLTSFGDKNSNMWQSLIGGVTPQQQQSMISEQDRYLQPQLQAQGLYDSGTAATSRLRAATDLSNQNAQFNVGALQNALNLALSGQAQVQSPAQGATSQLANQLSGLRTVTGTQTQTQNPFLQSFYSSLGTNLGSSGWNQKSGFSICWVAKEIFGSWEHPKTIMARYYIINSAPNWFRNFYIKYGEKISKFIHNKPILKLMLRPLFEYFAYHSRIFLELGGI